MKDARIIAIALVALPVAFACAFAQGEMGPSQENKPAAPATAGGVPQAKEMAIYGEIQSVNAASGTLSIQYYDYDSDTEKTTEVATGPDTKIENVKAIGDIKKGDWADVTYAVSGAKNVARLVSVEREEPEDLEARRTMTDVPSGN